jgi:hypothetical protein
VCCFIVVACAYTAPSLHRELWQGSWLAVLRWTPLQQLAQERAAVAQGGWQSDTYEADIKDCALFQAFLAAGRALRIAAAVSVSVEHMSCNQHVHIINVMMTRSRKVRSDMHTQ